MSPCRPYEGLLRFRNRAAFSTTTQGKCSAINVTIPRTLLPWHLHFALLSAGIPRASTRIIERWSGIYITHALVATSATLGIAMFRRNVFSESGSDIHLPESHLHVVASRLIMLSPYPDTKRLTSLGPCALRHSQSSYGHKHAAPHASMQNTFRRRR